MNHPLSLIGGTIALIVVALIYMLIQREGAVRGVERFGWLFIGCSLLVLGASELAQYMGWESIGPAAIANVQIIRLFGAAMIVWARLQDRPCQRGCKEGAPVHLEIRRVPPT